MNRGGWQPPERMPSRTELRPLPADLADLVRAGHLHQVEPGVYRRASSSTVAARRLADVLDSGR